MGRIILKIIFSKLIYIPNSLLIKIAEAFLADGKQLISDFMPKDKKYYTEKWKILTETENMVVELVTLLHM